MIWLRKAKNAFKMLNNHGNKKKRTFSFELFALPGVLGVVGVEGHEL